MHAGQREVTAVDVIDETVARVRERGPVPLPLDGWDQASIWGWDETTSSLYAHLWRNTDDPAKPPTIRIGPDDLTPAIEFPATLAQYIAMAIDCGPWKVLAGLYKIDDQAEEDWEDEEDDAEVAEAGTVVTMTEGCGIWWPPNFGSERKRPA